ncbi:hypothetical protein, partial [Phormidesmis priestleyi]
RHFYPDLRSFLTQQLSAHPHHLLVASLSNIMLDLLNQVEVAPPQVMRKIRFERSTKPSKQQKAERKCLFS